MSMSKGFWYCTHSTTHTRFFQSLTHVPQKGTVALSSIPTRLTTVLIHNRRQELPLNGGNGDPMSGYEANERCAADHHDHATRPTAHRADHTWISALQSAAPDSDLRSRSRTAAVQSMFACIDQHVDQSMFHCLLCLNRCVLACASTASMFASNQSACQRKKTSPDENLCSSPVKPTTTPPHSPCSSTSKLLVDHKCFFCQALRSRRSW